MARGRSWGSFFPGGTRASRRAGTGNKNTASSAAMMSGRSSSILSAQAPAGAPGNDWETSQVLAGGEPGTSDWRWQRHAREQQRHAPSEEDDPQAVMAGRRRRRQERHTHQDLSSRWTSSLHPSEYVPCNVESQRPQAITQTKNIHRSAAASSISALCEQSGPGPRR